MKHSLINQKGFTLIELMTSLSVFAVIMTISMGSILGVFNANRKSESLKTIMDNLNFTMETMSREIRFGKNYHCERPSQGSTPITEPENCTPEGNGWMSFLGADGKQTTYQINNTWIEKSTDGGVTFVAVTSPEVMITGFRFFVYGAELGDSLQPRVLIQVRGYAGNKQNTQSSFTLQTLVTQRSREN